MAKKPTNTPSMILYGLLKTKGSELGWERSVLISEAAQSFDGEPDNLLREMSDALDALMMAGIITMVGMKELNLVRLKDLSKVLK
ncbi:hypothetical protein [Polynucleobacter sp. AP-Ainpum-60-G11]|uniref:hypothetical protein n=1 Tax=Polynucleobacter sp. AP-Ainpum-60-G11 TaxID=2576926 RepID=UPI001BFE6A31|nr:hypothetical protein [Polynucleobacter sp. AP-Ainpum-60-G11]QWE25976.1 hypothetical protein FD971_05800 [Polynucleobacter sp. AP-Ainpum-60-G11]